ncbi:putative ABC-type dipeptide/oligopeptide transport system, permease component [Frankia canadensis]|uniref:Putative ABC-type dipeptide/oligopeptide transport system, permease component n=1 Tax=Frankia canadensis TaxID=1836972 RepID=A0A2I2KZJ8_9ACTN|nr:ABC transporter permease [Frankia canadensis]SNQ51088.1 putative ABC-type dipeptide/oligopeptide transport system, permease component [Frankia canadensis]SOU58378.1 putative ABC-type dipeptide/oligopeptide transport system, permease component [Frankia canadensis]
MSIALVADGRRAGGLAVSSAGAVGLAVARRVGYAVLVLWGAVTVTFTALHLKSGSTVDVIIGQSPVSPEVRAQIISDYALDKPWLVQYFDYLGHLLRGDLGHSYNQGMDVTSAIGEQILPSFELMAAAIGLALIGSVTVAVLTAGRPRWIRSPFSLLEIVGVAVPAFWLAILLLTVFSFQLHWFPAIGANTARGLVLPAVALAAAPGATLAQILRNGLERTLDEPFVTTARSRGIGEAAVLVRHALRHALMPAITIAGWIAGALLGGAVVIENVFSRQGLGSLTVGALGRRDFPLISGVVLVAASFYVVVNLLIDAAYPLLDPRLRPDATISPTPVAGATDVTTTATTAAPTAPTATATATAATAAPAVSAPAGGGDPTPPRSPSTTDPNQEGRG